MGAGTHPADGVPRADRVGSGQRTAGIVSVDGYCLELWMTIGASELGSCGSVGVRWGVSKDCTAIRSRCPFSIEAPVGKTSTSTGATAPSASGFSAAFVNGWNAWSS